MTIAIGRRLFLRGLASIPILVGMPELLQARPALPRDPYVRAGQSVSYAGLNLFPAPCFIGGEIVREIGPWDGMAYPCRMVFGTGRLAKTTVFPDHDLFVFHEEIPPRFWADHSMDIWPNVHAWIRWRRFGEDPAVSRAKSEAVRLGLPWPFRFALGDAP